MPRSLPILPILFLAVVVIVFAIGAWSRRSSSQSYPAFLRAETNEPTVTPEVECLWSIDRSLKLITQLLATIRYIAIWFLVLSILGLVLGFLEAIGAFR
jgi:hypothetical protein